MALGRDLFSWRDAGHANPPALPEGVSGFNRRHFTGPGAQFAGSTGICRSRAGRMGARITARGKVGRRGRRRNRRSDHSSGAARAAIEPPAPALFFAQRLHAVLVNSLISKSIFFALLDLT